MFKDLYGNYYWLSICLILAKMRSQSAIPIFFAVNYWKGVCKWSLHRKGVDCMAENESNMLFNLYQ